MDSAVREYSYLTELSPSADIRRCHRAHPQNQIIFMRKHPSSCASTPPPPEKNKHFEGMHVRAEFAAFVNGVVVATETEMHKKFCPLMPCIVPASGRPLKRKNCLLP